jgi:hypothetical protein
VRTRMSDVVSEPPCCKTFARSVCTTQTEPPFYKTFARSVCRVFAGSGNIEILSRSVDILVLARPGNFDVEFRCPKHPSFGRSLIFAPDSKDSSLTRWLECSLRTTIPRSWLKVTKVTTSNNEMEATSIFS